MDNKKYIITYNLFEKENYSGREDYSSKEFIYKIFNSEEEMKGHLTHLIMYRTFFSPNLTEKQFRFTNLEIVSEDIFNIKTEYQNQTIRSILLCSNHYEIVMSKVRKSVVRKNANVPEIDF
jgi:hypothetical protein